MKISDLKEDDIKIGLVVKSLLNGRPGTIVAIDMERDRQAWIQWEGDPEANSAFYGNDCECEILELPEDVIHG